MHTPTRPFTLRRLVAAGSLVAIAATATVTAALPVGAQSPSGSGVTDVVAEQIAAIEADKADRSPAEQKIDANLLYAAAEAVDGTAVDGAPELKSSAEVAGGRTEVDINATVDGALLTQIEGLGGEVVDSVPTFDTVRAVLPVEALDDLAAGDAVRTISVAGDAITNQIEKATKGSSGPAAAAGPVTSSVGAGASQADVTHGADVVRATYGLDGTGVKACVLSDGIGTLADRQASGDLPAVDILPGQAGTGSEGTAMLELIHDIAPGAELGFATAFTSQASFAQNIINLRADGCDVIVDDVTYFAEAAFQDDDVARAVSQVKADGAVYFTSAGNSGNLADGTSGSWQGDFQDAGASAAPLPAGLRVHGWGVGATSNALTVGNAQRTTLHWADPLLGSANDYDLYVLNSAGTAVARASTTNQTGTQDPFEITTASAGERLVVTRDAGAADRYLAVYTNRGRLTTATAGATYGHNASIDAISTAATPAAGAFQAGAPAGPYPAQHSATNLSEQFSSDGPSRSFFAPDGTPLTPGVFSSAGGQVRNAIDLTAADGATTTTPGFIPFFGTSAAAPNAAAMAVIALSGAPTLTPDALEDAMVASAIDIEAAGVDVTTGPGIAMAPALMATVGLDDAAIILIEGRSFDEVVGDGDAAYEPGEVFDVTQTVRNAGQGPATNVVGALTSTAPEVTLTGASVAYGTIAAGASATGTPVRVQIARTCECGTRLPFTFTTTFDGGLVPSRTQDFALVVAGGSGAPVVSPYTGAALPIPDNSVAGASATVPIGAIGRVADVRLTIGGSACSTTAGSTTVGIAHTYVGDLQVSLVSPTGTAVVLKAVAVGASANNLCQTVFSDAGTTAFSSLTAANVPFTGTFRPLEPLSTFAGEDAEGTWTLVVTDRAATDTGTIQAFSLEVTAFACDELANTAPTATGDAFATPFESALTVEAPGILVNDTDAELDALTAVVVDTTDHGSLTAAADGSFTYTPSDGFSGIDSFTYVAGDGALLSAVTVTITVAPAPPAVAGTVTSVGGPVAGVQVLAYAPTDGFAPTGWATTGADGSYAFPTLAPGSYALSYLPAGGSGFLATWRGSPTRAGATPVTVVGGAPLTGIDQQLVAAATISGVVSGDDGQPTVGVPVRAYLVGSSAYFPAATATTGAGGTYTLGGLRAGTYEVQFLSAAVPVTIMQWHGGTHLRSTADPIVVVAGSATTGIDEQVRLAGSITGTAGAPGVKVMAYSTTDTWVGSFQVQSQASGAYALSGLPAGSYKIAFLPTGGTLGWYGGATRATALNVVLTPGGTISGIDRTL